MNVCDLLVYPPNVNVRGRRSERPYEATLPSMVLRVIRHCVRRLLSSGQARTNTLIFFDRFAMVSINLYLKGKKQE